MTIKTRIVAIIALTVILTVGTTTAVVIEMQKRRIAAAGLKETGFLCSLIERATESTMSEGRTGDVQKIIEAVGGSREILKLRILSPDGRVLKSANRSEIGSKPPDLPPSVLADSGKTPAFTHGTVVDYFRRIPNRKACYSCHDSHEKTLGIIELSHDNSRNYGEFISLEQLLFFFCFAMVLIVPLTMSALFSRLVTRPLKSLVSALREVEGGNLNTSAALDGGGKELGELGKSFNKMIGQVNNLYKKNMIKERQLASMRVELEHKTKVEELNLRFESNIRDLEAANEAISALSHEVNSKNIELERAVDRLKKINELGQTLSSVVETEEVMKIIVQLTSDILNAERVSMHLKNTAGSEITVRHVKGRGVECLSGFLPDAEQYYSDLLNQNKPVFIPARVLGKSQDGPKTCGIAVPLEVKGHVVGAMILENDSDRPSFKKDELEILTTISNQAMVAIENAWLYESVKKNYFATIQSLVNALEASDRFTKGHSERVRILSMELGKQLGLEFRDLEQLEHAAILHDIGKIGIDNFVLQKQGKLTSREYGLVKTHPLIGDEILGPIENLEDVRKTIIQHHERYDGTGYPYGLKGDEITLKSRILSVVDTFDAMMTDRPYRKALDITLVTNELKANAGTQFDPLVVQAFMEILEAGGDRLLSDAGYNAMLSI